MGRLVVRCLTGEDALAGSPAARSAHPATIAAGLQAAGWPAERMVTVRDARQAAGLGWPQLVPAEERGGIGAAQLLAVCRAVLVLLGIGPESRLRDRAQELSPHDRALMADRPPHHGTVG